ncbi:MAG: hypothetical protein GXO65_03760, partial [Euryarchaeota archaeon]|nr:hypothetical protein [Euryarchaeota archaeon]
AYYIPAVFILLMPTLSVLLRAYVEPYEALYLVFGAMALYVVFMYTYFKYLTQGELPRLSLEYLGGGTGGAAPSGGGRIPRALQAYLPPEKRAVPSVLRGYLPKEDKEPPSSLEDYLPPKKKDYK